ncbi:MAG TPA: ATP-binding cassette domain-containing protein [Mycobacteriales bacterium]|nr:ATP-binding cassette domain-containing protein [Mycobacteriales bacterium]
MSTIEVRELSVRGAAGTLRRVELYVAAGEVVAVVGDASARALLRTVGGVVAPASGAVRSAGEELTGRSAAEVAARGVVLVPSGWTPFADLTVGENVLVGARGDRAAAAEVLGRLPALRSDAAVASLDAAEARTLAVAVGLARRPRVLLVDGLAGVMGAAAARVVLAAVRAAGVTALVAEVVAGPAARGTVEPAAYDRVLVARGGVVRPWRPA